MWQLVTWYVYVNVMYRRRTDGVAECSSKTLQPTSDSLQAHWTTHWPIKHGLDHNRTCRSPPNMATRTALTFTLTFTLTLTLAAVTLTLVIAEGEGQEHRERRRNSFVQKSPKPSNSGGHVGSKRLRRSLYGRVSVSEDYRYLETTGGSERDMGSESRHASPRARQHSSRHHGKYMSRDRRHLSGVGRRQALFRSQGRRSARDREDYMISRSEAAGSRQEDAKLRGKTEQVSGVSRSKS